MRSLLVFAIGLLLGPLSWGASYLISGKFEPFDNSIGFYLCQTVLAIPTLVIGLRAGMLRLEFDFADKIGEEGIGDVGNDHAYGLARTEHQ